VVMRPFYAAVLTLWLMLYIFEAARIT
jgi:hypothetical protein